MNGDSGATIEKSPYHSLTLVSRGLGCYCLVFAKVGVCKNAPKDRSKYHSAGNVSRKASAMKRMRNRLLGAIGLVSFAVLTLFLLPKFLECPSYGRVLLRRAFGRAPAPGPSTQFKWLMGATEGMPTGQTLDDEVFQCDDCVKVERRSAMFASEADAQNFIAQQAAFGKPVNGV